MIGFLPLQKGWLVLMLHRSMKINWQVFAYIAMISFVLVSFSSSPASARIEGFGANCDLRITGKLTCEPNNPYIKAALQASGGGFSINDYCPEDLSLGAGEGLYVFSRIVPCLQGYIQGVGTKFIGSFYLTIASAINATIMLAVVIYGIMIMIPGFIERISRDTFVFLLKITFVVWTTSNLEDIMDLFFMIMDSLIVAVTDIVSFNDIGEFGENSRCPSFLPMWVRLDCLVNMIIGIDAANDLGNGLLAFFFGSFVSGSIGTLVGIIGLYFTVNILLGILKAVHIYLMASMSIVFLLILGGMFIPLVFFKNTFEYFRKWITMITSMILQPVLLFAFLTIVLAAFDVILYSGENSVFHTIAGDTAYDADFNINDYMEDNGLYASKGVGFVLDFKEIAFNKGNKIAHEGLSGQIIENNQPDAMIDRDSPDDTKVEFPYRPVDWQKVAALRGYEDSEAGESEFLKQIFASFLMAGMASYIFITLLNYIPILAVGLAGGIHQAPILGSGGGHGGGGIGRGVSSVVDNVSSKVGSMVGGR